MILIVVIAAIPALGLILYNASEQRKHAINEAQKDTLSLARIAAHLQEEIIQDTRIILTTLAQVPEVRDRNVKKCHALMANLLKKYPYYANLGMFGSDGYTIYNAFDPKRRVYSGDLKWFKEAIKKKDFSIGEYQIGRITNRIVLVCGYPVLDQAGEVQSVVFAAIDLNWFHRLAAETKMVKGSTLTVLDRNGTILTRHPDPEKWIGKKIPDSPLLKTILTKHEGFTEAPGLDGAMRIYAFLPLGGIPEGRVYVKIGIPKDHILSSVHRNMVRNLIVLILIFITVVFLAWMGGNVFILRQTNALLEAAKRLSGGDLSVRIRPRHVKGELDQLADAFDRMADAIEKRETNLRESQMRLGLTIKASNVGLWDWDLRTNMVYFSREWKRQIGYEDHEISDNFTEWQSRVHPDDLKRTLSTIKAYLKDPWPNYEVEFRFRHKDGSYRWILTQASLLMDDEGKPYRMLGSHVDITERKKGEETLRKSEEKYRNLIDTMSEGLGVQDKNGLITFMNKRGCEMLGYELGELIGKSINYVFDEENQKIIQKQMARRHKGERQSYEVSWLRKDGGKIDTIISPQPYFDGEGNFEASVAVFTDITERKRAEEALRRSETFLDSIIEHSPYAMWISDDNGTLIRLNKACRDLLHITNEEVAGKYNVLQDNIVEEQGFLPLVKQVFEKGETASFTLKYDSSRLKHLELGDTTFVILDVNISPVLDASGRVANAIIQHIDITKRIQAEEEIRKLNVELEQRVRERTKELEEKNAELERMNRLFVGRELRMIELKKKIEELEGR